MKNLESQSWKSLWEEKNPHFQLFEKVRSCLPPELEAQVLDLMFAKRILWIKVSHPCFVQLLFLRKTAIMGELKGISPFFAVQDIRFSVEPFELEKDNPKEESAFSVNYAPTPKVDGSLVPLENERLRESMEALRRCILGYKEPFQQEKKD